MRVVQYPPDRRVTEFFDHVVVGEMNGWLDRQVVS